MRKIITFFRQLQDLYLIATSSFFDKTWYLENNTDVEKRPCLHYSRHGGFEGRDPGPNFSSKWYLDTNQDVKQAGINPLVHYLKYGQREGRITQKPMSTSPASYADYDRLLPPHFLIIGAQKAGTTALFSILSQHPQIIAPKIKEMHFFDAPSSEYGDFSSYRKLFPLPHDLEPNKLTFESSPSYLYHPKSPQRIYECSEKIKIIIILRDPVERAFSAWNMYHRFQHEKDHPHYALADFRSFDDAVMQEIKVLDETNWENNPIAYVKRGIYVEQIKRYYNYFSGDDVLILDYLELLNNPQLALKKVCYFLQIEDKFDFDIIRSNVSRYKRAISPKAQILLSTLYAPYNEELFEFLGRDFNWK